MGLKKPDWEILYFTYFTPVYIYDQWFYIFTCIYWPSAQRVFSRFGLMTYLVVWSSARESSYVVLVSIFNSYTISSRCCDWTFYSFHNSFIVIGDFQKVRFPAVTICNMNMLRIEKVPMSYIEDVLGNLSSYGDVFIIRKSCAEIYIVNPYLIIAIRMRMLLSQLYILYHLILTQLEFNRYPQKRL